MVNKSSQYIVTWLLLLSLLMEIDCNVLPIKRSSGDFDCYGDFEMSIFFKLDRLCEECYEMYREDTIWTNCR